MKSKAVSTLAVFLLALACVLVAVPASADVLYDNSGPGSFTTNAWSFYNSGGGGTSVTNSFTLSHDSAIDSITFYVWVDPLNSLSSETWSISATPFGPALATGDVTGGPNTQVATAFGYYSVLQESVSIPSIYLLGNTTYWFELSNGVDAYNIGVYWDESDGSSTAFLSGSGPIGSETFQVVGREVPEPSSLLLLGNGLLALGGLARRKFQG